MLRLYKALMMAGAPLLRALLLRRGRRGKEEDARLPERMGRASRPRPPGKLIWLHAASVGEAQSALILLTALHDADPSAYILVTTGTVTSAKIMEMRLPPYAFHQYYPLDHPVWIGEFLNHWRPDLVLWMESELWPNMLDGIARRGIPAALINARLSPRSARRWGLIKKDAARLLGAFGLILAQTEEDARNFRALGAPSVVVTDNLKYAAAPLPYAAQDLDDLSRAARGRPVWLYASTHDGEEDLACRLHKKLRGQFPGLLTVIAPRHPERRDAIHALCSQQGMAARLRGQGVALPMGDDDIYIADTIGELGLFYRLAPVACIGRSFSADGGGGHNPVEAALLSCAVLHGPNVQNLAAIYAEMDAAGAARQLADEADFERTLAVLLEDGAALKQLRDTGLNFALAKNRVLGTVMENLRPWLDKAGIGGSESPRACA